MRNATRILATAINLALCLVSMQSSAADPAQSASGSPAPAEPLYLLSYDHGGLVLWGAEHYAERLHNAVSWLDKYPGFKIGLDNEAYSYDALAAQNPQLLEQIRGWLKRYAGRFGIGTCTYGQPLSSFINEESNVRQLVQAIHADQRHFGYTPGVYLMSEHAMHSQIPQLLAGCGFQGAIMRTHFMMYGYNPTFDAPIGWWVGLDGSRLPTVPTYPGEGAAFGKTTVDNWILTRWPGKDTPKSLADFRKDFAHIQPLLATRADDSGLRREALVRECEGKPEYRWILLDELLRIFPKPKAEFRTEPNDFAVRMPWGYCGNEIWNLSRQAEVQVLTAERLAALELMAGGTNRETDLETAWKNLLVAQHHDIQICGLLAEARRFLPASLAASARARDGAMKFFAARMKGPGLLQVTAFNPVSWRRRQWLDADLSFPQKGEAKCIRVTQGGDTVPSILLSAERYSDGSLMTARVVFPSDLDGLQLAAYSVLAEKTNAFPGATPMPLSARVSISRSTLGLVTPFYEARLNPSGGLASLTQRQSGQPWLKSDRRSGFFAGTIDGEERESKGQWLLAATPEDAPAATAREDGVIGTIPYTFELTFHADTPRLDCRVRFHLAGQKLGRVSTDQRDGASGFVHEQKLRFKFFPAASDQAIGVRDLPFAIAETTNRYVEGNYWTALGDGHTGLAVFNRGTMGSVREPDGGFSVPLAFAMYYIWGTRMLNGDFTYEFALYPFSGDWRRHDLHRRALEYNFPMVSVATAPGTGELDAAVRLFDARSENVLLSALYPEGSSILARFYEYQGRAGEAMIAPANGSARLEEVDLLGSNPRPVTSPLAFLPWQIRTVRVGGRR
jgi:alpha-mannosidase